MPPRRSKVKRSKQFIEGYFACAKGTSRPRNLYVPYWLPEKVYLDSDDQILKWAEDWYDGWNQRFWGFGVNEVDP